MRDRIRIRRTAPKQWTVHVPTIGFGSGDTVHKPTHRAALREADKRIRRESSNVVTTEPAWQPSDRIAPTPTWSPLEPAEPE